MRKALPYILGLLALGAVALQLFSGGCNKQKKVSTWITLSKRDKNPYGAYVMYESLKKIFPTAAIETNTKDLYANEQLASDEKNRLMMIVLPHLNAAEYEIDYLMKFVEKGNNVFISAFDIGYDFEQLIKVRTGSLYTELFPFGNEGPFDMKQTLKKPVFKSDQTFSYPGPVMEGYFSKTDSTIARTLSVGNSGKVNFVQLRHGQGNLFVHLSPMSFSNYFLLYGDNHKYFEQVFSLLPVQTPTIIWDEHFIGQEGRRDRNKPNWFTAIMKNPSFRAGILTALLFLLIYTLIEMRRKQRLIPVIKPPVNDSLEFVKTMGLLYYQRKDHQNLAQKMSAYFLEHVRSSYRIFAKELDESFIKEVSYKSGADEKLVSSIVSQIKRVNNNEMITDTELITLQRNIETFYG